MTRDPGRWIAALALALWLQARHSRWALLLAVALTCWILAASLWATMSELRRMRDSRRWP